MYDPLEDPEGLNFTDSGDVHYDPTRIVRVAKCSINYLRGLPSINQMRQAPVLRPVDINKIRSEKDAKKRETLKYLKKAARGSRENLALLNLFSETFKRYTGVEFQFKKGRVISYEVKGKRDDRVYKSDGKRLIAVFEKIREANSNATVIGRVIVAMVDNWSNWDKATNFNIIGFMEAQANNELGALVMKSKKSGGQGRNAVLSETRREEVTTTQRDYFKKAS